MTCPVPVGKSQDSRCDQEPEASILTELWFQGVYKEPPREQNGMRNKETQGAICLRLTGRECGPSLSARRL